MRWIELAVVLALSLQVSCSAGPHRRQEGSYDAQDEIRPQR